MVSPDGLVNLCKTHTIMHRDYPHDNKMCCSSDPWLSATLADPMFQSNPSFFGQICSALKNWHVEWK